MSDVLSFLFTLLSMAAGLLLLIFGCTFVFCWSFGIPFLWRYGIGVCAVIVLYKTATGWIVEDSGEEV